MTWQQVGRFDFRDLDEIIGTIQKLIRDFDILKCDGHLCAVVRIQLSVKLRGGQKLAFVVR
jgi:hypothetical protein